jgi:hypothetical protein
MPARAKSIDSVKVIILGFSIVSRVMFNDLWQRNIKIHALARRNVRVKLGLLRFWLLFQT